MITISFKIEGGVNTFTDIEAFSAWVRSEADAWKLGPYVTDNNPVATLIIELRSRWLIFASEVVRIRQASTEADISVSTAVTSPSPIMLQTQVGRRIMRVLRLGAADVANEIIRQYDEGSDHPDFSADEWKVMGIEDFINLTLRDRIQEEMPNLFSSAYPQAIELNESIERTLAHQITVENGLGALPAMNADLANQINETIGNARRLDEELDGILAAGRNKVDLERMHSMWNTRAKRHRSDAYIKSWQAIFAGLLTMLFSAISAYLLVYREIRDESSNSNIHVMIFGVSTTLLVLSMGLWLTRILVRLYMANRHMADDASSRVVMGNTYITLVKEGHATEHERILALTALFRPISDGIVEDDGMPGFTPAAILSAALSNKAPPN